MSMNQQQNERYLQCLDDLAYIIKTFGATHVWKDMKVFNIKEYNELLLAALEELPK